MKYLHKFTSIADFQAAYNGQDYIEPWVSYTTYDQALSFTADISRSGGEFGPYDFTFYEEVDHLAVSLTNVTGTFYIWSNDSEGGYIVTTTRNITENTYYEHASWVEGSGYWSTSNNVGGSGYTLIDISSVVNVDTYKVHYNKGTFDGDLIVNLDNLDECNYAEIVWANDNINLGSTYALECEHTYDISSEADVITDPPSTLRVRFICNGEIHDEDLSTAWDSAWSLTSWEWQEHELVVFVYDDPCYICVWYGDGE